MVKFLESVKFSVKGRGSQTQGRMLSRFQLAPPHLILLEYDLDPEEGIGSTFAVTVDGT